MEIVAALTVAIVLVAVGAYFWGKRSAQKTVEQKSKETALKTIKAIKNNEINIKKLSDSDLDKLI